ncbi:MAG: UDP-N-acetylmuramoyl-L-alanine--D-glutamate ligase [Candidatus Cloacimonetes bacterium]|nr:UDP-N-acetylmuramoyl-L-alanine--D-glutamate ligase [Candidatus Cloacimonadota bacterium]
MNFKNKRVAVLGMACSGIAAAIKLKTLNAIPFLSEIKPINESVPAFAGIDTQFLGDYEYEFGGHSEKILDSDLIIISPGIPINIPILEKAFNKGIPVWSELELGFQIVKNFKTKIIAITGSNGKSTTATLIYHILIKAGGKAILAGNIGQAFTSFPIEKDLYDFIVLEVSSFQLDKIFEFKPDIGIILNITPDHLNRYENFDNYIKSKSKILLNQTENELAILNYDDSICRNIATGFDVKREFYSVKKLINPNIFVNEDQLIFHFPEHSHIQIGFQDLPIIGLHNVSNISASAIACYHCGLNSNEISNGILSFSGLEHRLEPITIIKDINFINDSKATNSASVKTALQSFDAPINLIMGGSNKNEDFSNLKPFIKKNVRNLILFGETKDILYKTFSNVINTYIVDNLKNATERALAVAYKGDYILLSPGCASYDMFKNFEDRGRKFKEIVLDLQR